MKKRVLDTGTTVTEYTAADVVEGYRKRLAERPNANYKPPKVTTPAESPNRPHYKQPNG